MAKTLNKKEMITAILLKTEEQGKSFPTENYLKQLDKDNLEFMCSTYGIEVYTTKTQRYTFERLIGYDFGTCVLTDIALYGSKKQYILTLPDGSQTIADYKTFKEMISGCDYPKK